MSPRLTVTTSAFLIVIKLNECDGGVGKGESGGRKELMWYPVTYAVQCPRRIRMFLG